MHDITSLRATPPLAADAVTATVQRLWASLRLSLNRRQTRAQEAAHVRALARQVRDSDPGFASDLLAAADRHDNLGR